MTTEGMGPSYRRAGEKDSAGMAVVEEAARSILAEHGVRLDDLSVPSQFQEATEWTFAVVAEVGQRIVGTARLTELAPDLVSLDQVSVDPAYGGRGIGRELLLVAAEAARELGYGAITGTTFRDLVFNGPFYASLGSVEDPYPHPSMLRRRQVEAALGLDRFGPRVIMRASL